MNLTVFIAFSFARDEISMEYSRSVFTFLDLTGNLGGLFEILEIAGSLIVAVFAHKIFLYSLLSRLYQIDTYEPEENNELRNISHQSQNRFNNDVDFNYNEKEEKKSKITIQTFYR